MRPLPLKIKVLLIAVSSLLLWQSIKATYHHFEGVGNKAEKEEKRTDLKKQLKSWRMPSIAQKAPAGTYKFKGTTMEYDLTLGSNPSGGATSGVFQAKTSITLEPGFESGTEFTAEVIPDAAGVPAPSINLGNANSDMNWIISRSFDVSGNVVGEYKSFFDPGGALLQAQTKVKYRKDPSTVYTHVFATQALKDAFGRVAANTMAAPINSAEFSYKGDFVRNSSGGVYDYRHFDHFNEMDKTNNPEEVGGQGEVGTLGWYYSSNNQWEPYTPNTKYPYSRTTFYEDGTGNVKKSGGIGEVLKVGSGREVSSFVTPVINELNHYAQVRNKFFASTEVGTSPSSFKFEAIQKVSRDANGKEAVIMQDRNGNTLMIARPGSGDAANVLETNNSVLIKPADVYTHAASISSPAGTSASIQTVVGGSGNINVYLINSNGEGSTVYTGDYSGWNYNGYVFSGTLTVESMVSFGIVYTANSTSNTVTTRRIETPALPPFHYFKILSDNTPVSITGGSYTLYNMDTEQPVSLINGASLNRGYYKLVPNALTTLTYRNWYTDVSYNFYNQLGQLVSTIAPEGVKKLYGTGINDFVTKNEVPFITLHEYDLQGRLVSSQDADGGKREIMYRKDGKIRFSQSSEQKKTGSFSYTNYDPWGRPIESGEFHPSQMSTFTFKSQAMYSAMENTNSDDGFLFTEGTKTGWVKTKYDKADNSHGVSGYTQDEYYLRGVVSMTENADSKTWYNYNEEGNVVWQIRYINGLGYKAIDYSYDVLGRIVKRVFQKDTPAETFVHYYEFDPSTQQLWKTYTNTVDNETTKQLQATYVYYLHGPLKRVELAGNLQGIDLTYTLDGKLKAINNSDKTKDPGLDGLTNAFLPDAFGMVLDYYNDDYKNHRSTNYLPIKGVSTNGLTQDSYNGQIKAMSWYSKKPVSATGTSEAPNVHVYKYDDKYQFAENVWGNNLNFSSTTATFDPTSFNKETVYVPGTTVPAYDANGNIKHLQRTDGIGAMIDNLTYQYLKTPSNTSSTTDYNTNKLAKVVKGDGSIYATYSYDELGQLTAEVSGGDPTKTKYIRYDVTGKVLAVARDAAFSQKVVEYVYGELGQRIIKRSYNPSTYQVQSTTYYTGNVLYTQLAGGSPVAQEYDVDAGIGRIGTFYRHEGIYAYELNDHLGNIRAVIARSGSSYEVRMYSDYYPYGMALQKAGTPYRYGYQGKYAEDETDQTGWNSFELRMYDSKIARWISKDPYRQFHSPYVAMGNDPGNGIDPDGGYWEELRNLFIFGKFISNEGIIAIYNARLAGNYIKDSWRGDKKAGEAYVITSEAGDANTGVIFKASLYPAKQDYTFRVKVGDKDLGVWDIIAYRTYTFTAGLRATYFFKNLGGFDANLLSVKLYEKDFLGPDISTGLLGSNKTTEFSQSAELGLGGFAAAIEYNYDTKGKDEIDLNFAVLSGLLNFHGIYNSNMGSMELKGGSELSGKVGLGIVGGFKTGIEATFSPKGTPTKTVDLKDVLKMF